MFMNGEPCICGHLQSAHISSPDHIGGGCTLCVCQSYQAVTNKTAPTPPTTPDLAASGLSRHGAGESEREALARATLAKIEEFNADCNPNAPNYNRQRIADYITEWSLEDAAWAARSTASAGDWVLVPREMEEAMMTAGQQYIDRVALNNSHRLPAQFRWVDFWTALLSASPAAPAGMTLTESECNTINKALTAFAQYLGDTGNCLGSYEWDCLEPAQILLDRLSPRTGKE